MDLTREGNAFGLDESLQPDPETFAESYESQPWQTGVRDTGGKVTLAIHDCPKPVIAAINGAAVGIGATLTLLMDMRLVSSTAKVGFRFSKLGIVPEACSTWFARIVGLPTAGLARSVPRAGGSVPAAKELARSSSRGAAP